MAGSNRTATIAQGLVTLGKTQPTEAERWHKNFVEISALLHQFFNNSDVRRRVHRMRAI